jgi:TfoX/Sxy family transcriptional regulator of competence genes
MTNHEEPNVYYASLEAQYLAREGVDLRRSLQSPGLAFHGSIFAMYTEAGLVVKVGSDAAASATRQGIARLYRPSAAHVSTAWLLVPFDVEDPHRWAQYVEMAYERARAIGL